MVKQKIAILAQKILLAHLKKTNKPKHHPIFRGDNFLQKLKNLGLLKACVCYFLFFHQMLAFQKLCTMLFISAKKLFSFSRYSNFRNYFPSFPHFADSKGHMNVMDWLA